MTDFRIAVLPGDGIGQDRNPEVRHATPSMARCRS